jgi:hypothetical protein
MAYHFKFTDDVDMDEVEASLVLAFFGAEALHGEAQVRLDADHTFDRDRRLCIIDSETRAGQDICRLFTGYLRREFTPDKYSVRRVDYSIAGPRAEKVPR